MCEDARLPLLFCSVDLLVDSRWDLAAPETFMALMQLAEEGLIDVVLGGPPCSTWSRARFRPGGLRPLRFRGLQEWGRWDATPTEQLRITSANVL